MAWKLTNGKESTMAEINITPLTDVMLVLLVVFMVTSPLLMMESMKLKLPHAETSGEESGTGLIVSITGDGVYYLNDREIKISELGSAISAELEATKESVVILKADKSVRHGLVVEVLDLARGAGALKLSIATDPAGQ
ncbi:MAG: biopolymer transporter ExbD [Thermodesulfobacteriota bacterium]